MSITKFRSWNKRDKRFYYFVNGGYFETNGNVEDYWRFNWKNAEQFTFKKDKDNVELYTNDIITCNEKIPAIIIWDRNDCCFYAKLIKDETLFRLNFEPLDVKKIGSIHENPELYRI